jgi:hypothetical protein
MVSLLQFFLIYLLVAAWCGGAELRLKNERLKILHVMH